MRPETPRWGRAGEISGWGGKWRGRGDRSIIRTGQQGITTWWKQTQATAFLKPVDLDIKLPVSIKRDTDKRIPFECNTEKKRAPGAMTMTALPEPSSPLASYLQTKDPSNPTSSPNPRKFQHKQEPTGLQRKQPTKFVPDTEVQTVTITK